MANCAQCGRKLAGFSFGRRICPWCRQHQAAQRGNSDDAVQRVETPPWLRRQDSSNIVTKAIFGMNVAVFLAMVLADFSTVENAPGPLLFRLGANVGVLTLGGEYWRLLTCIFLHGNLLHL